MLFQGTFIAERAAIANIGRSGKRGAKILFVEHTGRRTFATRPAEAACAGGTLRTNPLGRTLVTKSETAIIEGSAVSTGFFKKDVIFYFFRDCGAVLI